MTSDEQDEDRKRRGLGTSAQSVWEVRGVERMLLSWRRKGTRSRCRFGVLDTDDSIRLYA